MNPLKVSDHKERDGTKCWLTQTQHVDTTKLLNRSQNPSFVLRKIGEVAFEDRPMPEIQDPYDVIVNIKYTGICGSDVSLENPTFEKDSKAYVLRYITGPTAPLDHSFSHRRLHWVMNLQVLSTALDPK